MYITDVRHFDYKMIHKIKNVVRKRGNQGSKDRRFYKNIICAFDIETTNLIEEDISFMYVWQFQFGDICTIIGRTWEEYLEFLERLSKELRENTYIVIYVHNLSFEMSFLKGIYNFKEEEVFCTDLRKILKSEMMGHFEYRCSYMQTNMSLSEFARVWGKTRKQSGEKFDYKKIRYPWTRLNRKERKYVINDVRALVEAITNRMEFYDDNLFTIPLTSTGYVRRIAKREMKKYNHKQLMTLLPDSYVMRMLIESFRGGNTHCNRYMSTQIFKDVHSWDVSSSYPSSMFELFPMSEWYRYNDSRNLTIEKIIREMEHGRALLIRFAVSNIRMRNPIDGCPYIPRHKTRNLINPVMDNGRVLYAEYLEMTVTDVDFRIIINQYDFDAFKVLDMANSVYQPLPEMLTELVKKLFQRKTELKGIPGEELQYNLAKEMLNSVYGMMVQSPMKPDIKLINGEFVVQEMNFDERLEKSNKRAFLSYAWGVWVTAHSRAKLSEGINLCMDDVDGDGFIYCDTDSVKFIGDTDFSILNKRLKKKAIENGMIAKDSKGNIHYMGCWEKEPDYDSFISCGAKRYAYERNGKIGITVSGVDKKKGAEELGRKGGLKAFNDGFIFVDSGGTEARYNDNMDLLINVDGKNIRIKDNVVIKDRTYTMGLTGDYMEIINHPKLWLELLNN